MLINCIKLFIEASRRGLGIQPGRLYGNIECVCPVWIRVSLTMAAQRLSRCQVGKCINKAEKLDLVILIQRYWQIY